MENKVDMIWYDMIWYDMIWYDMIWYDMIWYDMIWYDIISYPLFVHAIREIINGLGSYHTRLKAECDTNPNQ